MMNKNVNLIAIFLSLPFFYFFSVSLKMHILGIMHLLAIKNLSTPAEFFIKSGFEFSSRDVLGRTPLVDAVCAAAIDTLEVLLKYNSQLVNNPETYVKKINP